MSEEILFGGGTVLTMASPSRVEAVLLRDGRIAAVGSESECAAVADDPETVDLDGATLMPGFIDAHCHPLMYGQFQTWADCGWEDAPDVDAVVEKLRRAGDGLPPERPIRGHGFNQGNVAEQRHLNRDDLDRVDDAREVLVFHSSGHGAYVNSWTLSDRGIESSTPDPEGGRIGRGKDDRPDGSLWDGASDFLTGPDGVKTRNHGPNFHLDDPVEVRVEQLRLAEDHFIANGITSVLDAQVTGRELSTYMRLRERSGMRVRVEMLILSSLLDQLEMLGMAGRLGDSKLALAGVKLYADGSLTAGTAHFHAPYCCNPLDHGYAYHDDPEEFKRLVSRAHRLGLQTGTHAQGDAAIGLALDALEAAQSDSPRPDPRHRIEHCGVPTPEQVQRIARLGAYPILQPQYLLRYGDGLLEMLGPERGLRVVPLGEFRDSGVPIVLSSDAPVTPPTPLEAIASAVARRTLQGKLLDPGRQGIDVELALHGHTLGAARAMHRERDIGSIEIGKHGDFAVLATDPTTVPIEELPGVPVLATWIGGRPVYAGGDRRAPTG